MLLHPTLSRSSSRAGSSFEFAVRIENYRKIEAVYGSRAGQAALASLLDQMQSNLAGCGIATTIGSCTVGAIVWDMGTTGIPEDSAPREKWIRCLLRDLSLKPIDTERGPVHLNAVLDCASGQSSEAKSYPDALFAGDADPVLTESASRSYRSDMALVSPVLAALGGFRFTNRADVDVDVCWQPIVHSETRTEHNFFEALLATIASSGQIRLADSAIFAAERLGFGHIIDHYLASRVADELIASPGSVTLMVSIAADSLAFEEFWDEVVERLQAGSAIVTDMVIEVRGNIAPDTALSIRATTSRLRQAGIRFSVGGFGLCDNSLRELSVFSPDFVTVDRQFFAGEVGDRLTSAMPHLVGIAKALGAEVIADGINHADAALAAEKAGITLNKGSWSGSPRLSRTWEKKKIAPLAIFSKKDRNPSTSSSTHKSIAQ